MKRWILRILLCLILGAITTVAVAWGCMLWIPLEHTYVPGPAVYVWKGDPFVSLRMYKWDGVGVEIQHHDLDIHHHDAFGQPLHQLGSVDLHYCLSIWRAGFPFVCLSVSATAPDPVAMDVAISSGAAPADGVAASVSLRLARDQLGRALPAEPIWRGFVIDILFYAAIWFALFFGFASAKRFIRIKRGRCPRCGYDLRGHRQEGIEAPRHQGLAVGCPECGTGREGNGRLRDKGTKGLRD